MIKYHVKESSMVGYNTKGKRISARELKKRVKNAQTRMNKGQAISHEEVEKESASW